LNTSKAFKGAPYSVCSTISYALDTVRVSEWISLLLKH